MANGFTYVAPLPQERKSFSEMIREQQDSRQQQQKENLAARVANQRERAQFQYKQLEKIYGFDVNGWSQDTIDAFKTRQDSISNGLKTGEYDNVTDLVRDIGELSALHGMGSSDAKMNMDGESAWVGWESGTSEWTQEGTEFSGDESGRNSRNGFTRGGSRSANRRVVNGRVVADYVDNTADGLMTLRDKVKASDPNAQLETLENGDQFMTMSDGTRVQVAGDVFNNPSVNNSATWAPPSRALGDVGVDSFAFELHGDVIDSVRGQEVPMSRKREIVQVALESTFNNGHATVNQKRMMQSAIAHWQDRNNQQWNGDNAGVDIDGLGPRDRYVKDALDMADLDQKQPQTQPRAPRSATSFESLQSNIKRGPMQAYDTRDGGAAMESVNPDLFKQYIQNEETGETIPNPDYLGLSQVVAASIPLGSKTVRFSPSGTEGQELKIDEVQVMKNGDAVIKFKTPTGMNEDDVRAIFRTSGDESAPPVEIVALASGEYAYRISNFSQTSDFARLSQAVDEAYPPLVVDGRPQPGVLRQEYKNLTK